MCVGGRVMLSVQKNKKITRTVPILKSNSILFSFNFFFLRWILKFLHMRGSGGIIRSEKWKKNHKNSTHSKSKFYIILILLFFSMMDINNFFFYILLYYLINVMIKTLYISNFIVDYVIYFKHSLYCYVLMCFPFS